MEVERRKEMKKRTAQLALFTLAALAVTAPAAIAKSDNPSSTIPFASFAVKGNYDVPHDKSSPGSLATQIEFRLAETSDGISPSTDQFLVVLEPAMAQLSATLPAIVVSLPGGCLAPHKKGGWAMGDGSVRDCGFELYHLFPDQSKADLTPFVNDAAVRLVEVIATKGWRMKLRIDFLGLDAAGIVTPTMIFASAGNDSGMVEVSNKLEAFGIVSPSMFPEEGVAFNYLEFKVTYVEHDPGSGSLSGSVRGKWKLGESSNGSFPDNEDLKVVVEPPPNSLTEPSYIVFFPAGCMVPHKKGGWTLADGSVRTCNFQYFQLFPDKSQNDLTPFIEDLGVRLVQSPTDKSWELKLRVDLAGLPAAVPPAPCNIVAVIGDDGGVVHVTSRLDFFGIVTPSM
jgi:hypothetical protein